MLMILSREIKSVLKFKDSVFIKIKDLKEKDSTILEQEILDENMKGITLSSLIKMEDPIRVGKEISMGESILMVEVKQHADSAL